MPVQYSVQALYGIVYRSVRDSVQRTISILLYIYLYKDNSRLRIDGVMDQKTLWNLGAVHLIHSNGQEYLWRLPIT
jgi:hypothetical protein